MSVLQQIEAPVLDEIRLFEIEFKQSLHSNILTMQKAIDYIMNSKGKHIRPLLLLLSAKSLGNINNNSVNAAVFLELLHTASLIHDDVVDETKIRRGKSSLNAILDNRISVLVGDFTLSTALARSVQSGNIDIIKIVSKLGCALAEGELFQMEIADSHTVDEEKYFDVIRRKTAALLAACTEIGAISAGADDQTIENFRLIGEYLGYVFQIRDDIFDYFHNDKQIGKPTGNDIREGKITLPLLYALNNAKGSYRDSMYAIINEKDFTTANVNLLIEFAKEQGGIEYAEAKMYEYQKKALDLLYQIPDSDSKNSLICLADYIITRNK